MSESGSFAAGTLVFVPDEQQAYVPMEVASCKGFGAHAAITVSPPGKSLTATPVPSSDVARVTEADPLSMEGAADMVKFSALTEAALLHNIRVRYARDQIYSSAGSILISVNPFKTLPIYTEDLMARCKACDAKGLQELPPHVYALAEAAFRGMLVERKPQAILITGESGAGKTEAAKYAVQYIVARSSAGRAFYIILTTAERLRSTDPG